MAQATEQEVQFEGRMERHLRGMLLGWTLGWLVYRVAGMVGEGDPGSQVKASVQGPKTEAETRLAEQKGGGQKGTRSEGGPRSQGPSEPGKGDARLQAASSPGGTEKKDKEEKERLAGDPPGWHGTADELRRRCHQEGINMGSTLSAGTQTMVSFPPTGVLEDGDKYRSWANQLAEAMLEEDEHGQQRRAALVYEAMWRRAVMEVGQARQPGQSVVEWADIQNAKKTEAGFQILEYVVKTVPQQEAKQTYEFLRAYEKETDEMQDSVGQKEAEEREKDNEARRQAAAATSAEAQGPRDALQTSAAEGRPKAGTFTWREEPPKAAATKDDGGWSEEGPTATTNPHGAGSPHPSWQNSGQWQGSLWAKRPSRRADAADRTETSVGKSMVSLLKYGGRDGHYEGYIENFEAFGCKRWSKVQAVAEELSLSCRQLVETLFKVPVDGKQRLRALLDEYTGQLYIGYICEERQKHGKVTHNIASKEEGQYTQSENFAEFWEEVLKVHPEAAEASYTAKMPGRGKHPGAGQTITGERHPQETWGSAWGDPIGPKSTGKKEEDDSAKSTKKEKARQHYKKKVRRSDKARSSKQTKEKSAKKAGKRGKVAHKKEHERKDTSRKKRRVVEEQASSSSSTGESESSSSEREANESLT